MRTGHMSLADMINFSLGDFTLVANALRGDEGFYKLPGLSGHKPLDEDGGLSMLLREMKKQCDFVGLDTSANMIVRMAKRIEYGLLTDREMLSENLTVLRETIRFELEDRFFYSYPKARSARVRAFDDDWREIVMAFPSVGADALAGVDCWALEHGTASVFHLMRVAERGLRALARERRVTLKSGRLLEYAEWEIILRETGKQRDALMNKPPSPKRDAAVEFYSGMLLELQGFKDVYRNNVNHSRESYDALQAESVLNHVYAFMKRLSSRLTEKSTRQIRWGIK